MIKIENVILLKNENGPSINDSRVQILNYLRKEYSNYYYHMAKDSDAIYNAYQVKCTCINSGVIANTRLIKGRLSTIN